MAELLLHLALVDLGRGGEAGAQRMPGELFLPLAFGQIAAHPGGHRGSLDEPCDVGRSGAWRRLFRPRRDGTTARARCA